MNKRANILAKIKALTLSIQRDERTYYHARIIEFLAEILGYYDRGEQPKSLASALLHFLDSGEVQHYQHILEDADPNIFGQKPL